MNYKEITDLIKLIGKSNLSEFKMKDGDFRLTIRTDKYNDGSSSSILTGAPGIMQVPAAAQPVFQAPAAPAEPSAGPAAHTDLPSAGQEEANEANYLEVRSPMVGTFYRSPSPDKAAYFKVGEMVNAGDVVCIVEAMKLFNEIESEVSGKIVKALVEDAQPVEYDQVLFLLDPKG